MPELLQTHKDGQGKTCGLLRLVIEKRQKARWFPAAAQCRCVEAVLTPPQSDARLTAGGEATLPLPEFQIMDWSRSFAVLAFLTTSAAIPAAAQPYPAEPYYGVISPREVMRTVAGMGLQPASEPRLRGHVWIVRGIGREGTIVRIVIDSHTGRVVDMHALRGPAAYEGGAYQPDPRYVMREQPYPGGGYPPAPRAGEVYQAPPYGGPQGALPDDEDDYQGAPAPQPRGYIPPRSSYPASNEPRFSSTPETKRVAAKPPAVPLPKARPNNIQGDVKIDAAKKDDTKKDAEKTDVAKKEEPKADGAKKAEAKKDDVKKDDPKQAQAPLTSPKDPETTASIANAHKKAQAEAKKTEPKKEALPPVQPLE